MPDETASPTNSDMPLDNLAVTPSSPPAKKKSIIGAILGQIPTTLVKADGQVEKKGN